MSLSNLTVVIATKDRWDDLEFTIQGTLEALGRSQSILIIDDGSAHPPPNSITQAAPGVRVVRDGANHGYIARRNELAKAAGTEFILSLDDDSRIARGNLSDAVQWLGSRANVVCIGFPVSNPAGADEVVSRGNDPYRCRQFIGCAHLMRVDGFRALGGYRSDLVHQGEEVDFAARAHIAGREIWHFPSVGVVHHQSVKARNWRRMDFYGARNKWLWNSWYLPSGVRAQAQCRLVVERLWMTASTRRTGHMAGIKAAVADAQSLPRPPRPMSAAEFRNWRQLEVW